MSLKFNINNMYEYVPSTGDSDILVIVGVF